MRVGILGTLEVVIDEERTQVGGSRLRAVLVRLALEAGRVVTVESLAEAIWWTDVPSDPVNALHTLVSRLRRALKGASELRWSQGGYCLDVPVDAVDALRFERLALEGRRALAEGRAAAAASHLREALALWRGEPLSGTAQTPYVEAAAGRLRELRLAAIEDRVDAGLLSGTGGTDVVAELGELIAAHPLRERLRGLHIRALRDSGRRAEALAAYEEFRGFLANELGTDPGQGLQDIHLSALRGGADREQPAEWPGRAAGSRTSLWKGLTSFVGREKELGQIAADLTEGRLVTLTGPGGAGKTRLATTFAGRVADGYADGVWLVELAKLDDPRDVPGAVIGVLGLREGMLDGAEGPRDAVTRLADVLSDAEAMLVLDNCEHLIDAVARLVEDLLGRCPSLRVLATSREPLGIGGEMLCPVNPLLVPEPGAPTAALLETPSIRLFLDRVAAVRPDLAVGADVVETVAEICRRLDGLPLAMELAAARLRALPLGELARRLDERFLLLTGGSRTALPRHQTLRAVVDWSWELLDAEERRFFQRLAVFPATITPAGADRVAAPPGHVLDALHALVDKSLLQVVDGHDARYRMLETIREYGLERLEKAGERDEARAAHAAFFLEFAERAEPHLRGRDQPRWLSALTAEHDNLIAALNFACESGDAATAVRLAAALGFFWTVQGDHAEASRRLRRALDVPGEAPEVAWATAVALHLFNLVLSEGPRRPQFVTDAMRRRIREARRADGHPMLVLAEVLLALLDNDLGGGLAVTAEPDRSLDPWTGAMARLVRSFLLANSGDMEGMRRELETAVEKFRVVGERWGLAMALTFLGGSQTALGAGGEAVRVLEESIRLMRELGTADEAFQQRIWLAEARIQTGDLERARADLLEAAEGRNLRLSARATALIRKSLCDLALDVGDLADAQRHLAVAARSLDLAPSKDTLMVAMLESVCGRVAAATGDLAGAQRYLAEALRLARDVADLPLVAAVGIGIARLQLRRGRPEQAAEILGACHVLHGAPGSFGRDDARLADKLRDALGADAFDTAYGKGAALEQPGALALLDTSCLLPERASGAR
ncbi:AfsR/SARP family transcriptional regulator [Actinomadura sp. NAK00032]|uniref:AfsR/SARP family transcriptional regulator n=1 Tax=Actinomadura sp. NAK00032 TaxID=2742128 RepID=UPI00158FD3E3|nr:BTAD domain-containing putative transcriptional regulator [Actinomadura sp. NAK00032]QKW37579.1 AfsR/SARP family transcriptional regulator [Actinomadura sp. NAK00032]